MQYTRNKILETWPIDLYSDGTRGKSEGGTRTYADCDYMSVDFLEKTISKRSLTDTCIGDILM